MLQLLRKLHWQAIEPILAGQVLVTPTLCWVPFRSVRLELKLRQPRLQEGESDIHQATSRRLGLGVAARDGTYCVDTKYDMPEGVCSWHVALSKQSGS